MNRKLVCVVDYGTSNTRVNAVDIADGSIVYSSSRKYLVEDKGKGYAQISVDHIWSFSEACMGDVIGQFTPQDELLAIAYSFFGDNLIPVDQHGTALDDCILFSDPRGTEEAAYINSKIDPNTQIQLIGDSYLPYKFGAKVLWVKRNGAYAKDIAYFDSQQQYVFRKLGLPPVNDYTMAARKQLLDMDSGRWAKAFLDVLDISPDALGDIVGTGDIVGYIRNYGSVDLKKSVPVIAGGHDSEIAMIGMGIIDETLDVVANIAGTFDHVGYLSNRKVNLRLEAPNEGMVSYNGPFPNTSVCMGAFPTAGATLEWFMREINGDTSPQAYAQYWQNAVFDGTGSLMVLPTLDGNRGVLDGIGVTTGKADIFRAVIEAITFENRRLVEQCRAVKAGGIGRVRIGGGPAKSDQWLQLRSDISGVAVERMSNIEAASLGGAILGAVAVGVYPDIKTAAAHMVHTARVFSPRAEVRDKYEEKYQNYCRRMDAMR